MSDIRLDSTEAALWREVGSRGDAFRRGIQDRAAEQTRLTGRMQEIIDSEGHMVGVGAPPEADPEPAIAGAKTIPVSERITQTSPVVTIDDAARKDGGKTTEDKPVTTTNQMKISKSAVDHTREEPGS